MKNIMKKQIERIFSDEPFKEGYELSGYYLEGEFMDWYDNGKIFAHYFFKKYDYCGEYKEWDRNGELKNHNFYINGEKIKMPDNIKKGYILVDGIYYKDII